MGALSASENASKSDEMERISRFTMFHYFGIKSMSSGCSPSIWDSRVMLPFFRRWSNFVPNWSPRWRNRSNSIFLWGKGTCMYFGRIKNWSQRAPLNNVFQHFSFFVTEFYGFPDDLPGTRDFQGKRWNPILKKIRLRDKCQTSTPRIRDWSKTGGLLA